MLRASCIASSFVWAMIIACGYGALKSTWFKTGIANAPVFPVPFLSRASTSSPFRMLGIALSYIFVATTKPHFRRLMTSSGLRPISEN